MMENTRCWPNSVAAWLSAQRIMNLSPKIEKRTRIPTCQVPSRSVLSVSPLAPSRSTTHVVGIKFVLLPATAPPVRQRMVATSPTQIYLNKGRKQLQSANAFGKDQHNAVGSLSRFFWLFPTESLDPSLALWLNTAMQTKCRFAGTG